jgi:hypothetical protein
VPRPALEALVSKLEVRALIFGVIVAIGVAGESVYRIRLWWNNRKLQALVLAESERQRAQIASLSHDTAQANAHAADANKVAEQERLARLQLEQRLAPRTLTVTQGVELVAALRKFTNQKYVFVTYQDDREAIGFAEQINAVLQAAGWQIERSKGFLAFRLELGLSVMIDPNATEQTWNAAKAFEDPFTKKGIPTTEKKTDVSTGEPETIQVRVWKKP